eukprot:300492-Pleurochrysis_carterae.AAC.2
MKGAAQAISAAEKSWALNERSSRGHRAKVRCQAGCAAAGSRLTGDLGSRPAASFSSRRCLVLTTSLGRRAIDAHGIS